MNITDIVNGIIEREGGYVNNPNDRGGPTRYGVTEAVARANGYSGDMRSLPRDFAVKIYTLRYWIDPRFNDVASFSTQIAEELTDTGVNMGPRVAAMFLQRALRAFVNNKLVVDGRIGPATLGALDKYLTERGTAGISVMLKALNGQQATRYIELAEVRPQNRDFVYGWIAHRT